MLPLIGIPCAFQEPQDELGKGASAVPQSYLRTLEMAGGAPWLIPITGRESTLRALYAHLDGLLLVGGVDVDPARYGESPHPALGKVDAQRDWVELTLTPWALADGLPLLGICRGIQTLNVVAGGSLWQDVAAQAPGALRHPRQEGEPYNRLTHPVRLTPDSRLANILGDLELAVNSLHHQAVKEVGAGLRVTARAPDGMIEGLEGDGAAWVVGVQWHPEWLLDDDPRMKRLFEAFVAACEEHRRGEKG
jgi:putative glutamine amidotransferase